MTALTQPFNPREKVWVNIKLSTDIINLKVQVLEATLRMIGRGFIDIISTKDPGKIQWGFDGRDLGTYTLKQAEGLVLNHLFSSEVEQAKRVSQKPVYVS